MKICHLADSHLGAGETHPRRAPSGLTERQEDIIGSFVEAVDSIIACRPDVCIHAGDLFHTVRPLNSIMAVAAHQLHRLAAEHGIPTVVIAGNHDAPRQPHVGAALDVFRQIDNLYIAAGGKLETFEIKGARFFALPHCLTGKAFQEQLALCQPDPEADFNVLILHGVAAGMPQFSMADLGELEIPLKAMEPFDYTALGHFHNFVQVAPRAFYSGSTERLSQSERQATKGYVEVELEPFRTRFREVSTREMVDVPVINAAGKRGDQLVEMIREQLKEINSSDKIVRVNIESASPETLKTMPADALAELKHGSFSLDIRFQREPEQEQTQFGRSAVGQLDQAFAEYLKTASLEGFDKERLLRQALGYLRGDE